MVSTVQGDSEITLKGLENYWHMAKCMGFVSVLSAAKCMGFVSVRVSSHMAKCTAFVSARHL